MYSIYFMKKETHAKLSFHCSDSWPPILTASTTYTKDGAQRHHNFRHFRQFVILGISFYCLLLFTSSTIFSAMCIGTSS